MKHSKKRQKIIITGAHGQVGSKAVSYFTAKGWDVLPLSHKELDITDKEACEKLILSEHPTVLFNCAAYTAVDLAETEQDAAFAINRDAVENLIIACNQTDTLFIHISTDYCFDGEATTPYTEESTPNPLSIYGKSKLAGDIIVQELAQKWIILRTGWVYSAEGNNFVNTMLHLARQEKSLSVVDDQKGTPTSALQIVEVAYQLLTKNTTGLYNCSALGETTWYQFAQEIFSQASLSVALTPCTSEEYKQKAPRPKYSVLSKNKLICLGITPISWQEALTIELSKSPKDIL